MEKPKKTKSELASELGFNDDIDGLKAVWHLHTEGSGQRKRYLRSLKYEKAV